MIEKLTEEQEALMEVVREEWIGTLCRPIDEQAAIEGTKWLYKLSELAEPKIEFASSPKAAQERANVLCGTKGRHYDWAGYGSIGDCGWLAFHDYFERIGVEYTPDVKENFHRFKDLINAGVYDMLQFDEVCIIVVRPIRVEFNDERELHCDGAAAIEWVDGYKVWALNGTIVSQYIAETPSGILDLEVLDKETNADVKTEFIRKYGMERLRDRGEVVDSYKNYSELPPLWKESEYELLDLKCIFDGAIDRAMYISMKNQSVPGTYHVHGVDNSCRTVAEALTCYYEMNMDLYEAIDIK